MSPIGWFLAPSLANLMAEVNFRWPNRDKTSDGTVGDPNHSSRYSDHNPDENGCVHAVDIDASGDVGDQIVRLFLKRARNGKLRCLYYIIYKGVIYSRTYNFEAREYLGANPHETHVHVSIHRTEDAELWPYLWGVKRLVSMNQLWSKERDDWKVVQRRLNKKLDLDLKVDGIYGAATRDAVKKLQRSLGYRVTGIPDRKLLRWLDCHAIK